MSGQIFGCNPAMLDGLGVKIMGLEAGNDADE
jgi:hypothetical protein